MGDLPKSFVEDPPEKQGKLPASFVEDSPAQSQLTPGQQGIQTQQNAANARWSGVVPTFLRNPLAGVAEAGNAAIQEGGALMAPLTETPVVGPIVKGAASLAGAAGKGLFNTAVQGGVDVGRSLGIPQFLQAILPQSAYSAFPPAARQEAADKWNELGSNATAIALSDAAGKGIAKGISKTTDAALAPFTQEGKQVAGDLAFKKANPPRANELNYDQQYQQAKPYLVEQLQKTPLDMESDLSPHEQGLKIATQAKQGVFDKYNPIIQNHPEVMLSGDDVASAVGDKISRYLKDIEPKRAAQIQEYASRYAGRDLSLPEANDYLTGLNAELSDYYDQPATVRAQMDATGVPVAAKAAAADALRGQMIKGLENVGESSVGDLRNDYGAVSQMAEAIRRNVVRADKPQPTFFQKIERGGRPLWMTMLAEGIGTAAGLPQGVSIPASFAASYLADRMGRAQLPTNQMAKALTRMGESSLTPADVTSTRPPIAGLLPEASYRMGGPTEDAIDVTTGQPIIPTPTGNNPGGVRGFLPPAQIQLPMGEQGMNVTRDATGTYPPQTKTFQYPRPAQGPILKPPWLRGGGNAEEIEVRDANKKLRGE